MIDMMVNTADDDDDEDDDSTNSLNDDTDYDVAVMMQHR